VDIVKKSSPIYRFSKFRTLMFENEKQVDAILESPDASLVVEDDRGYSMEKKTFRDNRRDTREDTLRKRLENFRDENAAVLQVTYDFFFGGTKRTLFPESEKTIRVYKLIHDLAKQYGLDFSASVSNPLDLGDGYVKEHDEVGYSWHYREGLIDPQGNFSVKMPMQTQWSNNKGPVRLETDRVVVYAFKEDRFGDTPYFYVNPREILDISPSARLEIMGSEDISKRGNGSVPVRVMGRWKGVKPGYRRCLAVLVYKTRELDYFAPGALDYMKSILDAHAGAGISYQGFYSDEMHIQFDWDSNVHFAQTEVNTRYLTPNLAKRFSAAYGKEFEDFGKYLVYFSYHQHDFCKEERDLPVQHILKPGAEGVYATWLFRKRYFELLNDVVVRLCVDTKEYAEEKFRNPIDAHGHATWKESPTLDKNYPEMKWYSLRRDDLFSRYDYHNEYVASSSVIEAVAGCYDYFRWNDYFTGGGTDHGEHGYGDRNYYAQAFGASLAVLNEDGRGYAGGWGSPEEVLKRQNAVGRVFGNGSFRGIGHDQFVQNLETRITDVLAVYPLDLFYSEERFGSWMVQYGYCNYITEQKLLEHARVEGDGTIRVKNRTYRALVFLYQSFLSRKTVTLLQRFVQTGGRLLWMAVPPVGLWDGTGSLEDWYKLFGVRPRGEAARALSAEGKTVHFSAELKTADMIIPTAMLPDFVYQFEADGAGEIAWLDGKPVGFEKRDPRGGRALYLAFRARDDQSQSMGGDISTLFDILCYMGAYSEGSGEARSRPASARLVTMRFPNGTVSITPHYRTFYERWDSLFGRDPEQDAGYLKGRTLPSLDLDLNGEKLFGHTLSYGGSETLSYRLDERGRLIGFSGNKNEITLDAKKYRFSDGSGSDGPGWICFAPLDPRHLEGGVKAAMVVFSEKLGKLTVPNSLGTSALKAARCKPNILAPDRDLALSADDETITLIFDGDSAGTWALVYEPV
jgi:hypothetical protein